MEVAKTIYLLVLNNGRVRRLSGYDENTRFDFGNNF